MNRRKIAYYLRNIRDDLLPSALFRKQLEPILETARYSDIDHIKDRLNYYFKIQDPFDISEMSCPISEISRKRSFYYYDLKEHARYFPPDLKLRYQFGDMRWIPERPSIVKSRPIELENSNSVIMKLGKFRHFQFPADDIPFKEKKPVAVWRGGKQNWLRTELVRNYHDHPLCDVGLTGVPSSDPRYRPFLSRQQQMAYRYIISIEGNDVATNLKWILNSNALCFTPRLVYETWFMEGRLRDREHIVVVADNFSDLEDKILYYENHTDEAEYIVRRANQFVEQFLNEPLEKIISLLVLYKYFVKSGQIEPSPTAERMIA